MQNALLTTDRWKNAFDYTSYRTLLNELIKENKTTGPNQDPSLIEYAGLNITRMNRLDKHYSPTDVEQEWIASFSQPLRFLTITEGWCGDAAQIVPVVQKLVSLNPSWEHKLLLRDDNLDIMDQFLTNGRSRSIPKTIVLSPSFEVLGHWGPRPLGAQQLIDELHSQSATFDLIKEKLHGWYAKDKGRSTAAEFIAELQKIHS